MNSPILHLIHLKRRLASTLKGKDAAIKLYWSRLEEEIMTIDTKLSHFNITKEESGKSLTKPCT